jgi:hypothetical protein
MTNCPHGPEGAWCPECAGPDPTSIYRDYDGEIVRPFGVVVRPFTDDQLAELHEWPMLWHLQDARAIDVTVRALPERATSAEKLARERAVAIGELLQFVDDVRGDEDPPEDDDWYDDPEPPDPETEDE